MFLGVFHRVSGVFSVGYNAQNTLTAWCRSHRGGGLVDGAVEHDVQAPPARGAHHGAEARTLVHLARRGGAAPVADSWERLSRCFYAFFNCVFRRLYGVSGVFRSFKTFLLESVVF